VIFKQRMVDAILAGEKTVTRRPVKYNRSGKILPCKYKVGGGPSGTYALQGPPEKGSRARAKTIEGYRLKVVLVSLGFVEAISDAEARREGFEDRTAFLAYWLRLYPGSRFKEAAWRIEFDLVETTPPPAAVSVSAQPKSGGGEA
jgi:hypothetical protein